MARAGHGKCSTRTKNWEAAGLGGCAAVLRSELKSMKLAPAVKCAFAMQAQSMSGCSRFSGIDLYQAAALQVSGVSRQ